MARDLNPKKKHLLHRLVKKVLIHRSHHAAYRLLRGTDGIMHV